MLFSIINQANLLKIKKFEYTSIIAYVKMRFEILLWEINWLELLLQLYWTPIIFI